MDKKLYGISMILLCGVAAVLFLYCTPFGVGLTNDSSAYIGGARSMLAGKGYVRIGGDGLPRPISHFPPFYSIVLAVVSRITKTDPLEAAKWVNFGCAVLNQALFMTALLILTRSRSAAFWGGITFLCAGPVLQAHIFGLSEALYMTLFLAVFALSVRAVRHGNVWRWLLIGLLSGALSLTRYAGLAAAAASAVFLLCALPAWKKRLDSLLLFGAGFILPFGYWLSKSNESGNSPVNRVLALHLPSVSKVEEGIRNFAGFFLPEFGGIVEKPLKIWGMVIAAGLFVMLALVVWAGSKGFFRPSKELAGSGLFPPALHGSMYMVMLLITVCFLDGSTLFDNRILLPFYVCMMLLIGSFLSRFMSGNGLGRIMSVVIMAGFALLLLEDELDLIKEFHRNGQGMAGEEWRESETRLAALELPADHLLWSNRQTAMSLLNDQPSFILPPMFDAASFSERDSFELDKAWMDEEVLSGNGYVVVFSYQDMMADEEDRLWLETVLEGLPLLAEYKDGAIFGISDNGDAD